MALLHRTHAMNPVDTLKEARRLLLKLHLELISAERAVYEKSAGQIPSPGAFLQLLAHDPWFEWLRPFSRLIAAIDDALMDRKKPVDDATARTFLSEIRTLLSAPAGDHGFGDTYRQARDRDPHVLAAHVAALRSLGDP